MIIQPTEQQATAIKSTFGEASDILAELRKTGKLLCTQEDEVLRIKKEPAPAVIPLTASTMGTPDAKPPSIAHLRLGDENVRLKAGIVELERQLSVARGEYRVAVIEVMHTAYVEAAEEYALKAEALANTFEDLIAIDKWFRTNSLTSELPPNFATSIHVPQLDPKTRVHLDGREATHFSICDTSNLLTEEGAELFRHARPGA